MSDDLAGVRSLSPEQKRALLGSLLQREPGGPRVAPLSFAQQRLWFLEQLEALGGTYHVPLRRSFTGPLDVAALRRALDRIVARHESLRTTFGQVEGKPVQRIAPARPDGFELAEHDLRGAADPRAALRDLVAAEAKSPFDLAAGPLIRGRLARVAHDEHVLLVTMHHVVSDGWSMGVFVRELRTLYDAFRRGAPDPLPALEIQYADYAAWQRRSVEGERLERQAAYWERVLAGAPELLELPADRPRPARHDFAGASVPVELDAELTAALAALSRRHETTLFMTLLAGWAVVLGRLSGQADVVVGTPTAGRERRETEELIGFFVHTLALRVDLAGAPTVAELLGRVRARALEAQRHQDIPFEQVVERVRPVRSLAYTPLFQVMFAWQNAPGESLELPGLQSAPVAEPVEETAKFDLSLTLAPCGDRIVGSLDYATALFDRDTVERHAGYLRRVLAEMVAGDGRRVEGLALLGADERARVLEEWNRTEAAYPRDRCVHQLVEAQVARTPGAAALVFAGDAITYAQLNARANRLAHHLRSLGVGPDVRVGICVERSPELVVGLLAVLKAGGAYVPLDPAYPAERLRYMLADSAPAVLLAGGGLAARFEGTDVPVLDPGSDSPAWASGPATDPVVEGLTARHLAYVIYTSGSTGRPKGVAIAHGSAVNLLHWAGSAFGDEDVERTLFSTSLNFDLAVFELFAPLTRGAAAWLVDDAVALLRSPAGVTLVNTVPSAMRALLDGGGLPATVRTVNLAGEALGRSLVERIFAETGVERVFNLYGPSETTTYSTAVEMRRGDGFAPHVGTPIHNTRVYILDGALAPVPVGVAGELHIGGAGVARGYLGRAELTAERFVADPHGGEPGARMYRTGDLARWRPDGTVELLGRGDHQVKVRGFRIEPGEIEARLVEHPAVREAVVVAREDTPGEKRLVAYLVGDESATAEVLRAHLGQALPAYMVPAAFVRVGALPLTPNGKLNRGALPAPDGGACAGRGYEAPVGETEAALAGIWSEVLGTARVGRRDDFFELGGHSLLAVQVISRVRQLLGVEAELGDVFTRPVLADFARELGAASRPALPPIEPAARQGPIPLSFAQQRLWFLEQLGELGGTYHMTTRLRLRGELDRAALGRALDAIVARHEALRTTFTETDGAPEQRIAPAEESRFVLTDHDLGGHADARAGLGRLMAEEAETPFDLERGPLIRGRLVRLSSDEHVLLLSMHHIVSDGWSMGVLYRELGALYAAHREGREAALPALPVQYADYAVWQRRWVEGDLLREQAEYWSRTLADAPEVLELPTDRPRPAEQDHAGAQLALELSEALTAGVEALSRRHGTTPFMTLLAAWAAVLGRVAGRDDLVIGTPVANRGRREVEGLIGFFVNTLALRVDLSGSPTVAELLERVKERTLGAQAHQDIPFEQVVELVDPVRSLSHGPLFQVLFVWQSAPGGDGLALPGLAVDGVEDAPPLTRAKFDLALALFGGERITGTVTYATALFDRATVERHVGYLRRVLEEMVAGEGQRVERLALMPADERARVVEEWNRTDATYPGESCIHELVQAQVERTPDATAVTFERGHLTYAELNRRANRLAHHLRALGVGPDVRVALCVERGLEMVVGLLAVLKAGGAYVPLDPGVPAERLAYMLADSAPAAVLTQGRLRERVGNAGVPVLVLDAAVPAWATGSSVDPERGALTPGHLAYVIYTSGSTGRPKGVMNTHRPVAALLAASQEMWSLGTRDTVLQNIPYSFDVSVRELFWPLAFGGRVHLPKPDGHKDIGYVVETIGRERITTAAFSASMLQLFLGHPEVAACTAAARVLVGGESLSPALVERFHQLLPHATLYHMYGPTETTVAVTGGPCRPGEPGGRVPIGRPLANTRAYVLDERGAPVPVGVAGELYIGGAQVARGYLGGPEQTAERFVADPFGEPGARLYRTGDLVRWLADGKLEFLGRTDHQVKVRGYRVELGEIEARLVAHPAVREAAVVAREDTPGEKRLVAYVVGGEAATADVLRAHLGEALPEYMVPAAYVRLERLPLMRNGKLDRAALPAPGAEAYAASEYEAPADETEEALAEIWAEVLRVGRVGRHDNFFELGGHSLLAVQVTSRVRQVLEVKVEVGKLFTRPVLADFAREVLDAQLAQVDPGEMAQLMALLRESAAG